MKIYLLIGALLVSLGANGYQYFDREEYKEARLAALMDYHALATKYGNLLAKNGGIE